jgi:tetratricopeptide (TPR) repeat protein
MPSPKPVTLAIRIESAGSASVNLTSLAELDAALAAQPESVDVRFARAVLLEELNFLANARGAYKGVLARDSKHYGALMNLGTMLYIERRLPEALILYRAAVAARPHDASALVNLANLLSESDPAAAVAAYRQALVHDPDHPTANFGLAILLEAQGDGAGAREHRSRAFATPILRTTPATGSGDPLRILCLLAASGGNLVTTLLLDPQRIEVTALVAESYRAGMTLPPHDLILNAIGDAERAGDALDDAERIIAAAAQPVLNAPAPVRASARANVGRFGDIPGVIAPRTQLVPRADITPAGLAARGFTYPLLLRAPGYHHGEHFTLVRAAADVEAQLAPIPGAELLVIAYLDTRRAGSADARKYRAFFIDYNVYPAHMAISGRWKVHYFSADMNDDRHWAEERAYLTDMEAVIGTRAMTALRAIATRLGLDYAGIDFGLGADNSILLFETNATMAISLPPDDARAAYRRPPVDAMLAATERMFRSRAARIDAPPAR